MLSKSILNLLQNKSELNKVCLLHEEKCKKDFLDATQLDYRTVPMLSQTLAYKSQYRSKYLLRWCRARDLFGLQIPLTTRGFELRISCIRSS